MATGELRVGAGRAEVPARRRLPLLAYPALLLLLFAVVHYAFRYLLRVSDGSTSPGYGDTPLALSVLKDGAFVLFALLSAVLLARAAAVRPSRRYRALVLAVLIANTALLGLAVVRVAVGQELAEVLLPLRYVWLVTFALPLLALVPPQSAHGVLRKLSRWLLPIALAFWAMTVALYELQGRLPALSYPGSPRFGGILDDPNGFGVLCVFLLAVTWGRARWYWIFALLLMLAGTRSLSAYLCLAVYLVLVALPSLRRLKPVHLGRVFVGGLVAAVVGGLGWLRYQDSILHWWNSKQGSLDAHQNDVPRALATLAHSDLFELLFGSRGFSENFYLYSLLNFGVVGTLVFVALALTLVIMALRSPNLLSFRMGSWGLAVLAVSWAIPYLQVYPVSLLFWAGLGLAVLGQAHGPRRTRRPVVLRPPRSLPGHFERPPAPLLQPELRREI